MNFCKFLIIFFFSMLFKASAQRHDAELETQLSGKTKFYDIKKTVEQYYKQQLSRIGPSDLDQKKLIQRDRKFWNRSFYEGESRLNANGEVENSSKKIFEYLGDNNNLLPSGSASAIATAYGNWQLVGPTSVSDGVGRINRIAFDPTNSAKLYAGSSGGGLFVSYTGGLVWSSLGSFIPSLGISGIVVSHANSNTIYVLTGDGDSHSSRGFTFSYGYIRYSVGVLKSTDGGNSWQATGTFPGLAGINYTGLTLVQDPNNANVLLAATSHGMFRTTNGGTTWALSALPGDDQTMVYDIEYKPGSSTTVYASHRVNNSSGNGRFVRSTDGGVNFTEVSTYSPTFPAAQRIAIAVSPASTNTVYILAGPGSKAANSFQGIWKSTNSGIDFTRMASTPNILGAPGVDANDQNLYDLALAVSPTSSSTVITGGLIVYRSTSSGALFSQATSYFGTPNIHPDVHDLAYNPLDGKLYAATDGGVAVSPDNGISWSRLFNGLSCTQFYHFAMQDDAGNIWGGAQDNGILIKNSSGSSFSRYSGGDGYDVLTDLPPAGNQDDKYYSVNEKVYADAIIDEDITPPLANNFFANLAMSPSDEDIIYAGYEDLYISYNRGSDWFDVSLGSGIYIPGNWCISSCPSNSLRLYSAGKNDNRKGIYRIDNIGIAPTPTNLTAALISAGYDGTSKITDIAVHPSNSNRIWVTIGNYISTVKVFYSSNGGSSWQNISGALPNLPVNCIIADASGNAYIGTDIGVYYRGNSDTDWTPFYNNLPRVAISDLKFLKLGSVNISLYASTYGRGIWYTDLFSSCASELTISSNLQGQQFFQAGNRINSTSLVNGAAGTNVNYRAGTEIILTPGFQAVSGTEFISYLGACNSGVPVTSLTNKVAVNSVEAKEIKGIAIIKSIDIDNSGVNIKLDIKKKSDLLIKIFDQDKNKYLAQSDISPAANGVLVHKLPVLINKDTQYRVDIYDGDTIISMQEIN